jgi:hypothetical protein
MDITLHGGSKGIDGCHVARLIGGYRYIVHRIVGAESLVDKINLAI